MKTERKNTNGSTFGTYAIKRLDCGMVLSAGTCALFIYWCGCSRKFTRRCGTNYTWLYLFGVVVQTFIVLAAQLVKYIRQNQELFSNRFIHVSE